MEELNSTSKITSDYFDKISITTLTIFALIICGTLYLVGYWTTFGINIFEFISVTDIAKSFAYPFIVIVAFALLLMFFEVLDIKFKSQRVRKFVMVLLTIILYSTYMFLNSTLFWIVLLAISFKIVASFNYEVFVNDQIKPFEIISFIYKSNVLFIPLLCFGMGKIGGYRTYYNHDTIFVNEVILNDSAIEKKIIGLKVLGHANDKIFFIDSTNTHYSIVNESNIKYISFRDGTSVGINFFKKD